MWRIRNFREWVSFLFDNSKFGKGAYCPSCGKQRKTVKGVRCICGFNAD
jgi:hypothetical protein